MSRRILPLTAFLSCQLGTWVLWVLCGKSFQNILPIPAPKEGQDVKVWTGGKGTGGGPAPEEGGRHDSGDGYAERS